MGPVVTEIGADSGDCNAGFVLLYYYYRDVDLVARERLRIWYQNDLGERGVRGRVRVALDGVNATLGGTERALLGHCSELMSTLGVGEKEIDFKLSPSSPRNELCRKESRFDGLKVALCKELVSLGPSGEQIRASQGAPKLDPGCFHRMLEEEEALAISATKCFSGQKGEGRKKLVLLDVRNKYESRVGYFSACGCELIRPDIRQFSEFPDWLNSPEAEALSGRRIVAYCTGGVRCERATGLLMARGFGDAGCWQLSNGIEGYLREYTGKSFFLGSNFVFDERCTVKGGSGMVVGRCIFCNQHEDDYGPRLRCSRCRLLLLVCSDCAKKGSSLFCECCAVTVSSQ